MNHAPDLATRVERILRLFSALAATWFLVAFVGAALLRMGHPFDLEWMEGVAVANVARVLEGRPVFCEPSLEFIPSMYTPLYYHWAAPFARALGVGAPALRAASFVAALGALALIAWMAWREGTGARGALLAAGLFAATWPNGGYFLDLARVDSLFLLLSLASVAMLREARGLPGVAVAGGLLALAAWTKQTALPMAVPLVALVALGAWGRAERGRYDARAALVFLAAFALPCAAGFLAMNARTAGWFSYFTVDLLFRQGFSEQGPFLFWIEDLGSGLQIACLAALVALALGGRDRDRLFFLLVAASFVGGAWTSRMKIGGYRNVSIPAFAILAILLPVGLARVRAALQGAGGAPGDASAESGASSAPTNASAPPRASGASSSRSPARIGIVLLEAACLVQFLSLVRDPRAALPEPGDRAIVAGLVEELRATEGDVLVPYHPELAVLAGKPRFAHSLMLLDIMRIENDPGPNPIRDPLVNALREKLSAGAYGAILLDDRDWRFERDARAAYGPAIPLDLPGEALFPRSGWMTRPDRILRPADGR